MELKQVWNPRTGCWEPQTNQDFIQSMNRKELAEFFAKQFCHGYGEEQIYEWLGIEHKEEQ